MALASVRDELRVTEKKYLMTFYCKMSVDSQTAFYRKLDVNSSTFQRKIPANSQSEVIPYQERINGEDCIM